MKSNSFLTLVFSIVIFGASCDRYKPQLSTAVDQTNLTIVMKDILVKNLGEQETDEARISSLAKELSFACAETHGAAPVDKPADIKKIPAQGIPPSKIPESTGDAASDSIGETKEDRKPVVPKTGQEQLAPPPPFTLEEKSDATKRPVDQQEKMRLRQEQKKPVKKPASSWEETRPRSP